jgi:hypothetical protein
MAHPWGDLLKRKPGLFEMIHADGQRVRAAAPKIPQKLAEPLAGMAAAGWIPPGAPTDAVVEKVLSKAWREIQTNSGGWAPDERDSAG